MVNRTPNLVTSAMKVLPPQSNASIVVALGQYDEMDVYADILTYGHVVVPPEKFVSAMGPKAAAVAPKEETMPAASPEEAAVAARRRRWGGGSSPGE